MKEYWNSGGQKSIKQAAGQFGISCSTAKKYINMPESGVRKLDKPAPRKGKPTIMDGYYNIIYKMLADQAGYVDIYSYICKMGYKGNPNAAFIYIRSMQKNNFPDRKAEPLFSHFEKKYPEDITVARRQCLLKYILAKDPKIERDESIASNIGILKEKYPCIKEGGEMFTSFHAAIMGDDPDKLDTYIEKYKSSKISGFCEGLEKDIAPVKNAISSNISSGFVEGNNNKFKLIKRIVYGKAGLASLYKKCKLAFMQKTESFRLFGLV